MTALEPTIRVPAVIRESSPLSTLKVAPPPDIAMALLPFGTRVTVLVPAFSEPLNNMSSAVTVIGALVVDIVLAEATESTPEPSVVMVTPVVPVRELPALELTRMLPLDPEDVWTIAAFPETACPIWMVPLIANVSVPLVEVTFPNVLRFPDAPVVEREKSPPTVDVSSKIGPA